MFCSCSSVPSATSVGSVGYSVPRTADSCFSAGDIDGTPAGASVLVLVVHW